MTSHFFDLSALCCVCCVFATAACAGKAATIGTNPEPATDAAAPVPAPLPDGSAGGSCMVDSDCPMGEACAWSTATDGCAALSPPAGTCVLLNHEACEIVETETACGCGNKEVTWMSGCTGFPQGWAPAIVEHMGPCADPGGGGCQTDQDCQAGYQCGFAIQQACAAQGECLPPSDFPLCNCIGPPACGCNGELLNGSFTCCGGAYANAPIAHTGPCVDGGP